MIAGLDSSFYRPSAAVAQQARAAGVQMWSGYLSTRPNVGLASPWDRQSFENARLCGATPIAFCSGWDDPVTCALKAMDWNLRLCLDVEGGGLRGDGPWVQDWLNAAGADHTGLYGNYWVFQHGFRAAFYIVGGYPGRDPGDTWGYTARPSGPCGWQWWGSHDEFGGGVDRGNYDDWFLVGEDDMTPEQDARLTRLDALVSDVHAGIGAMVSIDPSRPQPLVFQIRDMVGDLRRRVDAGDMAAAGQLDLISKALSSLQTPSVDVEKLASSIVAKLPPSSGSIDPDTLKALAHAVVDEIGVRVKPPL